jgi:hypothetical protein
MAAPQGEAAPRPEFEGSGEPRPSDAPSNGAATHEPGGEAAFRWSGDEDEIRRLQEEQTHHYAQWVFLVAIAVAIVSFIGVGLTLLH